MATAVTTAHHSQPSLGNEGAFAAVEEASSRVPALAPPSQEGAAVSPFCDRDFQWIRVAADAISGLCLALFYQIISLCCWVVSTPLSDHYASLARYWVARGGNELVTYLMFGSEVVDFCINSSTRGTELLPDDVTENEALRDIYGHEAIDRWSQIGTEEIPLNRERLSRRKMASDGCCLGMSLDFISHYLKEIRSGKGPLEAVKAIAGHYEDGASDEAELAQTFYTALDNSDLREKERAVLETNFNTQNAEIEKWLRAEQERIRGLETNEQMAQVETFDTQMREKAENLLESNLRAILLSCANTTLKRDRIVANAFGCALNAPSIYAFEEVDEQFGGFRELVNGLAQGAYLVDFSPQEGNGHAIVYIKTAQGQQFIHEPNFATLAIDPATSADRLWKFATTFYLESGVCSVSFAACSLS